MKYSSILLQVVLLVLILNGASAKQSVIGTNIGGWMVLEPWITPSLFYRFTGKTHSEGVGMDSYTFCEALGPEEGNKIMRAHWDTFYTEKDIQDLAERQVQMVRLPIGDWTLEPYGPYIGCMDGAKEKIDWMFEVCRKYDIKILLDVHCVKGSQNGFDNSGKATELIWKDEFHFSHWPNQAANWVGRWNIQDNRYENIDWDNIQLSVDKSEAMLQRWGQHPAFGAFQPVNEPWGATPFEVLFDFYHRVRPLVQKYSPDAYFVFHDAFTFDSGLWNDLFEDWDKVAVDHHYYQAWYGDDVRTTEQFCQAYEREGQIMDEFKMEVWIGEWSLATDVCAMWLGGFNDGNTDPQQKCQWVDCPPEYLSSPYSSGLDRNASILGPFGTINPEYVCIQKGKCSKDSDYFNNSEVDTIAKCALKSFNAHADRQFLWTAHNELEERWSYVKSWDMGWIKQEANQEIEVVI